MLGEKSTSGVQARIVGLADIGLALSGKDMLGVSRASTRLSHVGFNVAWHLFREHELCDVDFETSLNKELP